MKNSLFPIPVELNEIDRKSGLSPKTDRLAQHLCAFSNQKGGGFLVYGVNDNATSFSVTGEDAGAIIKKPGNIALNNLSQSIQIQHDTIDYEGNALLFIYIPEQAAKPVYLRGKTIYDSYHRSAGFPGTHGNRGKELSNGFKNHQGNVKFRIDKRLFAG